MGIQKILIANRGEISVRIHRAAKELGIKTVQVYSEADSEMLSVKQADESVCIGAPPAAKSYLNIDAIIQAAQDTNCDAVHPGYGFLAENPKFAQRVVDAGLIFIGPDASTIEKMGDKAAARSAAKSAGVPVVPGTDGRISSIDDAAKQAESIGYPVMIKAAAGGGGKGIRIADNEEELRKLAPQAQAEAKSSFGDDGIYLEKSIQNPRHIEVQILGDGEKAVHLYERECSLQRRRQKVWEEAGADILDEDTRAALCESAVALAEAVNYRGAGTVEYLYDHASKAYYFIEMNTRIQVEHPVSEMLTGRDLVQSMIQVCDGQRIDYEQSDVERNGHAIEVRINAEDPFNKFMPFPGKISKLSYPESDQVRFDHFMYEGYQIPPFYDSLLGKVIVHAEDRQAAIALLKKSLADIKIDGIKTTIPLHLALADSEAVQSGEFHTQWLEPWLAESEKLSE